MFKDVSANNDDGNWKVISVIFGVFLVVGVLLLVGWQTASRQDTKIKKEAAELGLLRYEADPLTGASKAYWIVPESKDGFLFKKVEAK